MFSVLKQGDLLRARYRLVEPIGQGAMGSIFLAEDIRLEGRFCAIKEVPIDQSASEAERLQAREQFYREASILARLDHPNLPKVSDFFNEEHCDLLVMDYIPGVDLRHKIEEARTQGRFIPEGQILDWAAQLCDTLQYLHAQVPPVLHRDIKPANIRLTPEGVIKLVDFGLVKVMLPDDLHTITILQGRGTAYYTPLEQYGGDTGHTDARSDVYALGATLYHLFTSEPPAEAKARFLDPKALRAPRQVNPALSLRTEQAVLWALQMHPDQRPPDVSTLRELLLSTGSLSRWPSLDERRALLNIAPVNRSLLIVSLGLLFLAVITTLLSPLSPAP